MIRGAVLILAAALSGCAAIEPDAVLLEARHQSNVLQHFESPPTDYGMNTVGITARWQRGRWQAEVSEAYAVQGIDACVHCSSRDVFDARVGYELWVRP